MLPTFLKKNHKNMQATTKRLIELFVRKRYPSVNDFHQKQRVKELMIRFENDAFYRTMDNQDVYVWNRVCGLVEVEEKPKSQQNTAVLFEAMKRRLETHQVKRVIIHFYFGHPLGINNDPDKAIIIEPFITRLKHFLKDKINRLRTYS